MSDLAPFVAAALRDRTVTELFDENQKLREEINKINKHNLRVIRVTGPGGSPVYAQRHIAYAKEDPGFHEATVELNNSTDDHTNTNLPICPVQDIEKCELHIGDEEVIVIGDFERAGGQSSVGEPEQSMLYEFQPNQVSGRCEVSMGVEWGPTSPVEQDVLAPEEYRNEDIAYVRFTDVAFVNHPFAAS